MTLMKRTPYPLNLFVGYKAVWFFIRATCLSVLLPLCSPGQTVPIPVNGRPPQAPPPAPPIVTRSQPQYFTPRTPPEGNTPYSIGNPTDEEQLYLEYLNRARANPPAEGLILATTTDPNVLSAYAYYGVDTNLMQSQFNAIAAAPPVAMNAQLLTAARVHSQDMFINMYQGHTGTDNSTPGDRITAQGYNWYTYGENVYSYSYSVFYGHAGFEVDWGPGTGGMQTPPGHRLNIHNNTFREVGVGVVDGVNGTVGPQLVTQDFATQQSATPLITGVVYYDLNGNGFYDVGEGIGGVTVQVPGSTYFAITASSGGYAIPVTTNGNYAISFSASGLSSNRVATIAGLANVKVDFVPPYTPPALTGPNPAALTNNNYYSFPPVGAATNHQCEVTRLIPYTTVEGAENGLANVTVVQSSGYSVIISDFVYSGSYAFHLCQPDAGNQYLTLNPVLLPRTNSQLTFYKRLGWATSSQVAHAQVSTNGGSVWQDVWNQAGSGGSGESAYSQIAVSLGFCAGIPTQIRFVYDFSGGSYYPQTASNVGLCLDNIAVSNADQAQSPVTNNIPTGNFFVFYPTNTGDYQLRVCGRLPGRTLPWGPAKRVTATNLPPMTIQFAGQPMRSGTQFQAGFNVANYRGMPFQVLTTTNLATSWTTDTLASIQTVVTNSQFRVTTTNAGTRAFFRIQASQ